MDMAKSAPKLRVVPPDQALQLCLFALQPIAKKKGNKPLGAAFQHARRINAQRGGSKKQERQIAENYLKREGHGGFKTDENGNEKKLKKASGETPPKGVQQSCQRGLELAPQYGGQGLTDGAKSRARAMANGEAVSQDTLGRMRSFFARHGSYEKQANPPSPGYVAWMLWGGDDGKRWADSFGDDIEKTNKSGYHHAFVATAKADLPPYFFDKVHQRAKASAGGVASGAVRRAKADPDAALDELWDRRNVLADELQKLDAQLGVPTEATAKAVTPSGQTHVDVPLTIKGAGTKPRKKARNKERLQDDKPLAIAKAALRAVVAAEDDGLRLAKWALRKSLSETEAMQMQRDAEVQPDRDIDQKFINATRLVAGMDWEKLVTSTDDEEAKVKASRQLAQDMAYYDNKLQTDEEVRGLRGLDLDLGSGQARQRGYLGLDLYPYDYGTAIYDLGLGLPFEDGDARSIRLVNVLRYMPDADENPTSLLLEIQRVLTIGGKLFYEGVEDLTLKGDWTQLPGLVLVGHDDAKPLTADQDAGTTRLYRQVLQRVRVRVPRVYGADPTWLGSTEQGADDIDFALRNMGGAAPAERTMADLMRKSAEAEVAINGGKPLVADKAWKQIIYSVVYAPNELDHDGEYMEADDIEKMAHDMYRNRIPVKIDHQGDPIDAEIVELYVAPADFTIHGPQGPQAVPKGAAVAAVHVKDPDVWRAILDGKINGVSVGGRCLIEQR